MMHMTKTLVLAAALLATGGAQAERARATILAGMEEPYPYVYSLTNLQGFVELTMSESFREALSYVNAVVVPVAPGILFESDSSLTVAAPFFSLSGTLDTDGPVFELSSVRTGGGALMTTSATLPSGKRNFASTGGSLSLTNIRIDLDNQDIYATLSGANGVGIRSGVKVWRYGSITGDTTLALETGQMASQHALSELTITDEAFNLIGLSLGLNDPGRHVWSGFTDYGVIDVSMTFDYRGPPSIPEPSTYMLMGLGLVGLAFASRRARIYQYINGDPT